METKPGWKTSEFWLKALVTVVVLPVIGFFTVDASSPLPEIAAELAAKSPVLAVVAPLAKGGLVALLGIAAAWLAAKYGEARTALKLAALKADGP